MSQSQSKLKLLHTKELTKLNSYTKNCTENYLKGPQPVILHEGRVNNEVQHILRTGHKKTRPYRVIAAMELIYDAVMEAYNVKHQP